MKKNFILLQAFLLSGTFILIGQQAQAQTTINWGGASGLSTLGGSRLSGTKTGVVVGTKTIDIAYNITYTGDSTPTFDHKGADSVERELKVNWANTTSTITMVLTFSSPVAITTFPIKDVGYDNDGSTRHNDRIQITGINGGNTTNNILQFGADTYSHLILTPSSNGPTGPGAPSISAVGSNADVHDDRKSNILFKTNSTLPGVTQITIVYSSGTLNGGVTDPAEQKIKFLPFTISSAGASNAPLPVNFANVSAKQTNSNVLVSWSNLTESDINYYAVERSADGKNFETIGKIQPKANDYSRQDYSFTDAAPINRTNFYRIKAVEFNNSTKSSVILKVSSEALRSTFVVYPNPVQNKVVTLQAGNISAGAYFVQVVNTNGQQVFAKTMNFQAGAVSQSLELPAGIKPGMYMLKIESADIKSVTTLFVQ